MIFKRKKNIINDENNIIEKEIVSEIKEELLSQEKLEVLVKDVNNSKSKKFYDEDKLVIDKYKSLKTPAFIKEWINDEKYRKPSNGWDYDEYKFFRNSLKFSNKFENEAEHFPFMEYWPDFTSLNNSKVKKWYFYWRSEIIKGNMIETDLSYIYLFVYELLNYSFNPRSDVNLSLLEKILIEFGEQHSNLQKHLVSWIRDMLLEIPGGKEVYLNESKVYPDELMKALSLKSGKALHSIGISFWRKAIKFRGIGLPVDVQKYSKIGDQKFNNKIKKYMGIAAEYEKNNNNNEILNKWFEVTNVNEVVYSFSSAKIHRVRKNDKYKTYNVSLKKYIPSEEFEKINHDCVLLAYYDSAGKEVNINQLKVFGDKLDLFYKKKKSSNKIVDYKSMTIKELKLYNRDNGAKEGNKFTEAFKYLIYLIWNEGENLEKIESDFLLDANIIKTWVQNTSKVKEEKTEKVESSVDFSVLNDISVGEISLINDEKVNFEENYLLEFADSNGMISKNNMKIQAIKNKKLEKAYVKNINIKYFDKLGYNLLEENDEGYQIKYEEILNNGNK